MISIELTIFLSFLFTSIFGVIFHFAHKKFPTNFIIHMFCPVNESVWEHTKLSFSPMLIASILEYFLFKNEFPNMGFAIFFSIFSSILLVPLLYYPIRYLLGKEIVWVSISLFFVVVILAYVIQYLVLLLKFTIFENSLNEMLSLIAILFTIGIYSIFTFKPPKIPLYQDPLNNKYGDTF